MLFLQEVLVHSILSVRAVAVGVAWGRYPLRLAFMCSGKNKKDLPHGNTYRIQISRIAAGTGVEVVDNWLHPLTGPSLCKSHFWLQQSTSSGHLHSNNCKDALLPATFVASGEFFNIVISTYTPSQLLTLPGCVSEMSSSPSRIRRDLFLA